MRPDVPSVIARWSGAAETLAHVRDGANAIHAFRVGSTPLILRLTQDAHRRHEQLDAELEFVRFVAARGVAVALPCSSIDGAVVESFRAADGELWHAVVFSRVPGRHFRYHSSDIDRPLFRAWGEAMGALHAASREFVPAPTVRRPTWAEQDTTACDEGDLPREETEARREHARITEWLHSLGTTTQSWGLIHGDFERTNFMLDGSSLRFYDFDDACYHWYLADVANALWAFRNAPRADRERFLTWFLEGYRERSTVEAEARDQISWFVRLRSLSLFIRHLRDEGGVQSDEWAARMRASFAEPFRW